MISGGVELTSSTVLALPKVDRAGRQLTNGRILSRILNVFFPPRAMQLAQVGLVLVIGSDQSSLGRAQLLPRGAHKRQTTMEIVHVELISTKLWSTLSPKGLPGILGRDQARMASHGAIAGLGCCAATALSSGIDAKLQNALTTPRGHLI